MPLLVSEVVVLSFSSWRKPVPKSSPHISNPGPGVAWWRTTAPVLLVKICPECIKMYVKNCCSSILSRLSPTAPVTECREGLARRKGPAKICSRLSGPTATVVLSRYTVALHSVALRFPGFGGVSQENRTTPPERVLWHLPFQLLKGMSHFKSPLGSRSAGGCHSYTVACRPALGHYPYTSMADMRTINIFHSDSLACQGHFEIIAAVVKVDHLISTIYSSIASNKALSASDVFLEIP